jgi:hypothetical protein
MRSNGTLGYGDNSVSVQLDASQPIEITLTAGGWNAVLSMIAKAPWDVADPFMQAIRRQIAIAVTPPSGAAEQTQGGPSNDR